MNETISAPSVLDSELMAPPFWRVAYADFCRLPLPPPALRVLLEDDPETLLSGNLVALPSIRVHVARLIPNLPTRQAAALAEKVAPYLDAAELAELVSRESRRSVYTERMFWAAAALPQDELERRLVSQRFPVRLVQAAALRGRTLSAGMLDRAASPGAKSTRMSVHAIVAALTPDADPHKRFEYLHGVRLQFPAEARIAERVGTDPALRRFVVDALSSGDPELVGVLSRADNAIGYMVVQPWDDSVDMVRLLAALPDTSQVSRLRSRVSYTVVSNPLVTGEMIRALNPSFPVWRIPRWEDPAAWARVLRGEIPIGPEHRSDRALWMTLLRWGNDEYRFGALDTVLQRVGLWPIDPDYLPDWLAKGPFDFDEPADPFRCCVSTGTAHRLLSQVSELLGDDVERWRQFLTLARTHNDAVKADAALRALMD